jgi:hypothetical protein
MEPREWVNRRTYALLILLTCFQAKTESFNLFLKKLKKILSLELF